MKSPEAYFLERPLLPEDRPDVASGGCAVPSPGDGPTDAERLFLRKYMGVGGEDAGADALAPRVNPEQVAVFSTPPPASSPDGVPIAPPVAPPPVAAASAPPSGTAVAPETPVEGSAGLTDEDLAADARMAADLQLVGFKLGAQEFALPIGVIQEVIRFAAPTKLPAAPDFLAGMINLRGKVTPLVYPLRLMGRVEQPEGEDRFIVVCRRKGLQLGLIIQAVSTMYRPAADQIEWNIEAQVGVSADHLAALIKNGDGLIAV